MQKLEKETGWNKMKKETGYKQMKKKNPYAKSEKEVVYGIARRVPQFTHKLTIHTQTFTQIVHTHFSHAHTDARSGGNESILLQAPFSVGSG